MSGQYQGILGVARLKDLEKAYGMLPAFSFPVAAVPYQHLDESEVKGCSCNEALLNAGIDVEWVLSLLGVAGGSPGPVGDYLPHFSGKHPNYFLKNRSLNLQTVFTWGRVLARHSVSARRSRLNH